MVVLTLSVTVFAYYVILSKHQDKQTQKPQTHITKNTQTNKNDINQYYEKKYNAPINKQTQPSKTTPVDPFEEYNEALKKEYIKPKEEISTLAPMKEIVEKTDKKPSADKAVKSNRPKLSIIIDDVTLASQIRKIQNIGYTVTMSFMPPTTRHKDSASIAQDLSFYMIHFPLQAQTFKFEEEHTLHVGDSYEKIEARVKQIRQWYPNALYTNNHTGSKFTSDDDSMDKLMRALKKYQFIFMDSRTTSKTVVKKYAKKYNMPYIARNIFLDNEKDYDYIQKQLIKAIKIAKRTGHAIAIGHPYGITIKVLTESKGLLEGLDLVYANEIPLQ